MLFSLANIMQQTVFTKHAINCSELFPTDDARCQSASPPVPDILYVISWHFPLHYVSLCPHQDPVNSPFYAHSLTKVNSVSARVLSASQEAALHIPGSRVLCEGEQGLSVVIRLLLPPGHLWPWHRGKVYGAWKQNNGEICKPEGQGLYNTFILPHSAYTLF